MEEPPSNTSDEIEMRILMIGLDDAGKTAILYRFKSGQLVASIPSLGYNDENITYENINFKFWDVGGKDTIRALWNHFAQDKHAIIYVVDSTDRDRMDEAKRELNAIIDKQELWNYILLVYANKQDLGGAMKTEEIQEKLGLSEIRIREWHIQPSSAKTGEGLYEGLAWLSSITRMSAKRTAIQEGAGPL